jgi:hypothetical protein
MPRGYLSQHAALVRTFIQQEDYNDEDADFSTTAEMSDKLLKFIVTSNIAFRAVENRHLRRLFDLALCAWFTLPDRRHLASTVLTRVASTCDSVNCAPCTSSTAFYGCTVASDGWSNRRSINFINCMLVSSDQIGDPGIAT